MEYDRSGYRWDGELSGWLQSDADLTNDAIMNPDRATRYGDYYVFDPTNPSANSYGLVGKAGFSDPTVSDKGLAEVDCLMCHLDAPYNNEARDYCMTKPGNGLATGPGVGATLGLTLSGVVSTTEPGSLKDTDGDGVLEPYNPSCDYNYNTNVIDPALIVRTPKKDNCALCHFPLKTGSPKGKGPGGAPLDWTTFQKYLPAGAFTDSDTGAPSASSYTVNKGRAEFGKRGESINDPANPDMHQDGQMVCADCHYNVTGDFPALTDANGNVIQGALTGVTAMDHQIAKGNNRPDGKNMDQIDNTVTCEACHVTMDHPRIIDNLDGTYDFKPSYTAAGLENTNKDLILVGPDGVANTGDEEIIAVPVPTHVAFPALHFDKIDCRTCHITHTNFVKKQMMADYSSTPYPEKGIGRGQFIIKKVDGKPQPIGYTPLYTWMDRGHDGSHIQLQPVALGSAAVWKDLASKLPYSKRFATAATVELRTLLDTDGTPGAPYTWTINSAQGDDQALIINTANEIDTMVKVLSGTAGNLGAAAQLADPALNIFINTFTVSHNVHGASQALGGPNGGGCAACHSENSTIFASAPIETDVNKPCYGQPEGCKGLVFMQPKDGGVGLEMTCDGGDCTSGTARITGGASFNCWDGSKFSVSLTEGVAHKEAVKNVLPQEKVICYNDNMLSILKEDMTSPYFDDLYAEFQFDADEQTTGKVTFYLTLAKCPDTDCRYDFDLGDDNTATTTDSTTPIVHTYAAAGEYGVTLTVTDVDAAGDDKPGYFETKTRTVTAASAAPAQENNVAFTQTDNVISLSISEGGNGISKIYALWGDSSYDVLNPYNNETSMSHTYSANSTYYVRVYVYDDSGQRVLFEHTVTVNNL